MRSIYGYGRSSISMQNDQPRANVTDDGSDGDIKDKDEADWHDEVNVEELAPRHRSKLRFWTLRCARISFNSFPTQSGFCRRQYGRFRPCHLDLPPQKAHIFSAGLGSLHHDRPVGVPQAGLQERHTISAGRQE